MIGGLRIDKVKPRHILDVIEEVADSNRPAVANEVLGLLNQLFKFTHRAGYIQTIPSAAFTIKDAVGTEKPNGANLISLNRSGRSHSNAQKLVRMII